MSMLKTIFEVLKGENIKLVIDLIIDNFSDGKLFINQGLVWN